MIEEEFLSKSNTGYDGVDVVRYIRKLYSTATSTSTDAFTQCACKHDLFLLKCLIEDMYKELPDFPQQEKEWEQNRFMEILKNESTRST